MSRLGLDPATVARARGRAATATAAAELGVDRAFGRGTPPGEVASHLAHALAKEHRT